MSYHPKTSHHSPSSSATSLILFEEPGTPKIHNKRYSEERSFEQLQRSLKRVRLSSGSISPGEIRLERDLRHAELNHRWTPKWNFDATANNCWTVDIGATLPTPFETVVTILREDTMELILCIPIPHQHSRHGKERNPDHNHAADYTAVSTTTTTTTTIKVHMTIPKRYPHQPPTFRRIEYQPSMPNVTPCGMIGSGTTTTPTTAVSKMYQNPFDSRGESILQKILIPSTPAAALTVVPESGTAIYWDWSPVHRLTDICDWVITTILQQHHCKTKQMVEVNTSCFNHHYSIQVPTPPPRVMIVSEGYKDSTPTPVFCNNFR